MDDRSLAALTGAILVLLQVSLKSSLIVSKVSATKASCESPSGLRKNGKPIGTSVSAKSIR